MGCITSKGLKLEGFLWFIAISSYWVLLVLMSMGMMGGHSLALLSNLTKTSRAISFLCLAICDLVTSWLCAYILDSLLERGTYSSSSFILLVLLLGFILMGRMEEALSSSFNLMLLCDPFSYTLDGLPLTEGGWPFK